MAKSSGIAYKLLVIGTYLVLQTLSLLLLAQNSRFQQAGLVRAVQSLHYRVGEGLSHIRAYFLLGRANTELALENSRLRTELSALQALLPSLEKGFADVCPSAPLRSGEGFVYTPAEVVTNSLTRQRNYLILNKGIRDGLAPDMGVITASGAVGVVESVSPHFCRVVSLLNTRSRTSVRLSASGAVGSMQWEGTDPTRMVIPDILQHIAVAPGDTVRTSGYSTFYPQDLPIGVVERVRSNKGVYYSLDVRLFQDFSALRHVYVATSPHAAEIQSLIPGKDE